MRLNDFFFFLLFQLLKDVYKFLSSYFNFFCRFGFYYIIIYSNARYVLMNTREKMIRDTNLSLCLLFFEKIVNLRELNLSPSIDFSIIISLDQWVICVVNYIHNTIVRTKKYFLFRLLRLIIIIFLFYLIL